MDNTHIQPVAEITVSRGDEDLKPEFRQGIEPGCSMTLQDGTFMPLRQVLCDSFLQPTAVIDEDGRFGAIEILATGAAVVRWRESEVNTDG